MNAGGQWPATVEEAVALIVAEAKAEDLERFAKEAEGGLAGYHHTLGREIRNRMGLWRDNTALLADCRRLEVEAGHDPDAFYREHGYEVPTPMHPDDASMVVVGALWRRAREMFPQE